MTYDGPPKPAGVESTDPAIGKLSKQEQSLIVPITASRTLVVDSIYFPHPRERHRVRAGDGPPQPIGINITIGGIGCWLC